MFEGLEVADFLETHSPETAPAPPAASQVSQEHVSPIATADSLVDYRPCRPADFVGRAAFQKELWSFFESVRTDRSKTRLVALTGSSGYGKSSLVARLTNRFSNKKWRNRLFLYAVDVRSARGTVFVSEVILQAIRAAQDVGFIKKKILAQITDAESILSGESMAAIFDELRRNRRLLIIFFDQFEEIFTKDELLPLFRVFKRMALDLSALQPNMVVGFSWRTGITLSDDNPAYQLWHEIADHRFTKTITSFDAGECSRMIAQFERLMGQNLAPPFRRRLVEQSQGMPWLLKKLCIHVYRQIKGGKSQIELLNSRLNVKTLFDEDLEPLTEAQTTCLRYIAVNSPADSSEVYNRFPDEVISALLNQRIILRTGQRFTVYWDIFRDYIAEGSVPAIPWTYIPTYGPAMSAKAFRVIEAQKEISLSLLSKQLEYTENTTVNIVTDLLNMMVCEKNDAGWYIPAKGVNLPNVAERVRSQFSEHVVYRGLLSDVADVRRVARDAGIEIVRRLYSASDVKPETRADYFSKLIPWLRFAGLVETVGSDVEVYPLSKYSEGYGKVSLDSAAKRPSLFTGAAPPETSWGLLKKAISDGGLLSSFVVAKGFRNAAQDLIALGLCFWKEGKLVPVETNRSDLEEQFRSAIARSATIIILDGLLKKGSPTTRGALGDEIGRQFGRQWQAASSTRYANGLYQYWKFINGQQTKKKC